MARRRGGRSRDAGAEIWVFATHTTSNTPYTGYIMKKHLALPADFDTKVKACQFL